MPSRQEIQIKRKIITIALENKIEEEENKRGILSKNIKTLEKAFREIRVDKTNCLAIVKKRNAKLHNKDRPHFNKIILKLTKSGYIDLIKINYNRFVIKASNKKKCDEYLKLNKLVKDITGIDL